jgi:hypothetical protein
VTASTWPWVLAGVGFVLVAGLLLVLLLGAAGLPGDRLRRLGQSLRPPRSERGGELPGEVPETTAEETARLAEDERKSY